jgi:Trk K+ transport system NAD-binding subunit
MLIVCDEAGIPPRGSTRVEAGDRLFILSTGATRGQVARLLRRWEKADARAASPGARSGT